MWRLYRLRRTWVVFRLRLRDGDEQCAYCHCEFIGTRNRQRTIDHIVALAQGGTWRVSNLVWACAACNRRKGDGRVSDFIWSEWLRQRQATIAAENPGGDHTSVVSVA